MPAVPPLTDQLFGSREDIFTRTNTFSPLYLRDKQAILALCLSCISLGLMYTFSVEGEHGCNPLLPQITSSSPLETFAHSSGRCPIHPPPPGWGRPKCARSRGGTHGEIPMSWWRDMSIQTSFWFQSRRRGIYGNILRLYKALETSRGQTHLFPSCYIFALEIGCIYFPSLNPVWYY